MDEGVFAAELMETHLRGIGRAWLVTLPNGGEVLYPLTGGEWDVREDGTLGRQLEGTCDVRAPADPDAMRRWMRREYREWVDMSRY